MAPSNKNTKRKKSVMDLGTKLKIIQLLKSGEKVAALARRYEVNESTVRSIPDNAKKIQGSAAQLGSHAKCAKISRGGNVPDYLVSIEKN